MELSSSETKCLDSQDLSLNDSTRKLKITRHFSQDGLSPYDTVKWSKRDVVITDDSGKAFFTQKDVEAPAGWSDLAVKIVTSKYFWGQPGTASRENSVKQLVHRVCKAITDYAVVDGYLSGKDVEVYYDELVWLCLHQHLSFNSPVWFNVGLDSYKAGLNSQGGWVYNQGTSRATQSPDQYGHPQSSACFIVGVEDTMDSLMDLVKTEAMLFKFGSGTGTDLTPIRSSKETLSGGGKPSGPMSFLKIYDQVANVVKSGGKCLAPQQLVFTQTGPVPVENLALAGEPFICLSYDPPSGRVKAKIAHAWKSGQKPLVKITTDKGQFMVSADHPMKLADGSYSEASKLTTSHSLFSSGVVSIDDNYEASFGDDSRNHKVLSVESAGMSDVYSVEVECQTVDDKTPSSGHNFMIWPMGVDNPKSGVFVSNTRRAAKMNILRDSHPDIEEFIEAKPIEEKKAWALIEQGYDGSFNGDAYASVMYQNENLSVRVSDEFMKAATTNQPWWTKSVTTGENVEKKDAGKLLTKIAQATWMCGDPGMQFDDTIQKYHTCAGTEPIYATNPCAEYVFINNTACNLASLNLLKFYDAKSNYFDAGKFKRAVQLTILAQEVLIDNSSYPTKLIAENAHTFRTIGLGYANLGALLMTAGLPYDSQAGRNFASVITSLMTSTAYNLSAIMAQCKGPFRAYKDARCAHVVKPKCDHNIDSMLKVLKLHSESSKHLEARISQGVLLKDGSADTAMQKLAKIASETWDEVIARAYVNGVRNAQVTVLAPTGTISFMMDCATTGIEPEIALVKTKNLVGGGTLNLVNQSIPNALRTLGYDEETIEETREYVLKYGHIDDHNAGNGQVIKSPVKRTDWPVFDTSIPSNGSNRSINYTAHIKMMAAAQPFISGAISKTINMPQSATVDDIRSAYILAWELDLKCVAIYRDMSKRTQPLNAKKKEVAPSQAVTAKANEVARPIRRRLPDTRKAVTHKFNIAGHEGYLTVGLFDDNTPGELFVTMAKEGSTIGGLMDAVGTLTSMNLQYGVPVSTLSKKFRYTRFEPSGYTSNPDIRSASSLIDYIFHWIDQTFSDDQISKQKAVNDNNTCGQCGATTQRSGSCHVCPQCGTSAGCS